MALHWEKGHPADPAANILRSTDPTHAFNVVNFPEVDTSDDTPIRWEDTVGARIAAENLAEHDGTSFQVAWDQIRQGVDGRGNQVTPREGEVYPDGGADGEGG